MKSEISSRCPTRRRMAPSNDGPYFEMRSYTLQAGGIPEMAERWKEHLPGRTKLSPLTGVFTSRYRRAQPVAAHLGLQEPRPARRGAQEGRRQSGIWPPPGGKPGVKQENKIVLAAPFSPIK